MRSFLVLLLTVCLLVPPVPVGASDDLPDIGSPADSILSRDREMQIGRAIFRSLLDTERVMTDPEIQEYLRDVGQRLAAHSHDGNFDFHFFMVEDGAINAFALPGGYIGVHSGLLLATRTESELAGVMAHEISHVTQRHISRAIFANQRASILTMAALLGAILIGAAGGGGDLVQGAIAGAQSMAIQQQINFTRSNEYEADRVGVGVLAAAGFDPMGMPAFFETLARQTGPLASRAPEFLRTHPVTVNRIAETRERALAVEKREVTDSKGYILARARARVLTSRTPQTAMAVFEGQRADGSADLGTDYGVALVNLELARYDKARTLFQELKAEYPSVIHFHTGLAAAEQGAGDTAAAVAILDNAMALFPRNVPLTVRFSEILLQTDDARRAHRILLDLFNNVAPTPEQVRLIARAASLAGDTADAHHYMAEFHLMKGDLRMAADQLRLALSIPGLDAVQQARFRSRLEQVQEWLTRQQREEREQQRQSPEFAQ